MNGKPLKRNGKCLQRYPFHVFNFKTDRDYVLGIENQPSH